MKNQIREAFCENKTAVAVSAAILLISVILGYVLEPQLYTYLNPVVEEFTKQVRTGVIRLTFQDIFFNNIRIVFQMFLYGILFCLSALILAFNGFFVGYYVATVDDLFYAVLLIIPHGIFEFSSCIIACSSGIVLFSFFYSFVRTFWKDDSRSLISATVSAFKANSGKLKQAVILLAVASVLMAVAGFVEAYLTLPIAKGVLAILR